MVVLLSAIIAAFFGVIAGTLSGQVILQASFCTSLERAGFGALVGLLAGLVGSSVASEFFSSKEKENLRNSVGCLTGAVFGAFGGSQCVVIMDFIRTLLTR